MDHDDQITSQTTDTFEKAQSKFGPQTDGSYISPYKATIYYDPTDYFEVACAVFMSGARGVQKIPMCGTDTTGIRANLNEASEAAEYITEQVILFDHDHIPTQFFARGFQKIVVLGDAWPDYEDTPTSTIIRLSLSDFLTYIRLTLAQRFVVDHFALLRFPQYDPVFTEITAERASLIKLTLITRAVTSGGNIEAQMAVLTHFDALDIAAQEAMGIKLAQSAMVRSVLMQGVEFTRAKKLPEEIAVVCSSPLDVKVRANCIEVCPKADYLLIVGLDNVMMFMLKPEAMPILEYLATRGLSAEKHDDGWLISSDFGQILSKLS